MIEAYYLSNDLNNVYLHYYRNIDEGWGDSEGNGTCAPHLNISGVVWSGLVWSLNQQVLLLPIQIRISIFKMGPILPAADREGPKGRLIFRYYTQHSSYGK